MAKKRVRKHKVSEGKRVSFNQPRIYDAGERALNKVIAWRKGKNPWITIANDEKNKPFIRVRANSLWGNPKKKLGL